MQLKSNIYKGACAALLVLATLSASAQTGLRSAYFMPGYNYNHELNPALAPERGYIALPGIGGMHLGTTANVGVSTFLYPIGGGNLTTFMSPRVGADEFLGKLHDRNNINQYLRMPVFSLGFRAFGGYNTFGVTLRQQSSLTIPKDLFTFMKRGMAGPDTRYDFTDLGINSSAMAELSIGHSHRINDRWRIGVKAKALAGIYDVNARISHMTMALSAEKWAIQGQGEMTLTGGPGLNVPTRAEAGKPSTADTDPDQIAWDDIKYDKPGLAGKGFGVDLGVTYTPHPLLTLSASVTDLGMMEWNDVTVAETPHTTWTFDGFHDISVDSSDPDYASNQLDKQVERLGDDLQNCFNLRRTRRNTLRTTMLGTTIHAGASYTMPFTKAIVAGVLYTERIDGIYSWREGRASLNILPCSWLDFTASYALSSFGDNIGWYVNFHPVGLNIFAGTDFQFLRYTSGAIPLPVGNFNVNAQVGINFTFGSRRTN